MSRFRMNFHTSLASQMADNVYYQKSNLFYYLGRLQPWEENPLSVSFRSASEPVADSDDAHANDIEIRDNILYMKKITSNDISLVTKKYVWERGTVYTQWDDRKDMTKLSIDHPFYVLTSDFNVYKCIFNNWGKPSTVEPTEVNYNMVTTSDGYIWKFMYNIPTVKRSKFLDPNYMPVQRALTDSFYSLGAIEEVIVTNGGEGYSDRQVTSATVSAPENGKGRQAKISVFIDKSTGSIEAVSIDDAGEGYTETPTITVNDRTGRGTSKYSEGGTAVLTANILNGKLDSVVIVDCGINYPANEDTTLSVTGDGKGCVLYPKVSNGKIVGVIVANCGEGYTYLNVKAVSTSMQGRGATFQARIGGSNLTSNQSTVEQTAVDGAIYAIEVVDEGDNYSSETTIRVDGDGHGCFAEPVIENGSIKKIIVKSNGRDYSYADIVFLDPKRLEPNNYKDAKAYPILPPRGGHGADAVNELYANIVSTFVSVRDDNKLINLNQDYRQFGMIENPRDIRTKRQATDAEHIIVFKLKMLSTVDLNVDSIVYIDGVRHRVVAVDIDTIVVQQLSSIFHEVYNYSTFMSKDTSTRIEKYYEIQEVLETPTVDKYSGNLLISSNNTAFVLTSGRTFAIRSYIRF